MSFQAKQRASILWLLSKAYNNDIPPELCEPYYKIMTIKKDLNLKSFKAWQALNFTAWLWLTSTPIQIIMYLTITG